MLKSNYVLSVVWLGTPFDRRLRNYGLENLQFHYQEQQGTWLSPGTDFRVQTYRLL